MGKPQPERHLTGKLALAILIAGMLGATAWNGPGALVPCGALGAAPATSVGMYHGHGPYPRMILELSGMGRYRYDWWGCYSTYIPWGERSGWYVREGDVLRLRSLTLCTWKPFEEPEGLLVRIRWGAREYLVSGLDPDQAYARFVHLVKEGSEPRDGPCGRDIVLLRDGDWKLPVSGMAELPAKWRNDFAAAVAAAAAARSARATPPRSSSPRSPASARSTPPAGQSRDLR